MRPNVFIDDANAMLDEIIAKDFFMPMPRGFLPANSVGDDIEIYSMTAVRT